MRVSPIAASIAACILAGGCVRDAEEEVCPALAKGDLIVTEIGGPQTGNAALVPWIELYNASGGAVDLRGLKVRFRRPDGSLEVAIVVRSSLIAAPGSYTVLGLDEDDLDSYLDYSFAVDYQGSWFASAAIDVETCGAQINRARYESLPRTGTYSLGTMPPDPDATQDPTKWCTDTTVNDGSFPGTPKRANTACP